MKLVAGFQTPSSLSRAFRRNCKLAQPGTGTGGGFLPLQLQHLQYVAHLVPASQRRGPNSAAAATSTEAPSEGAALLSVGPGVQLENSINLRFDNDADPKVTVVTVTGFNQINLLNKITGVFGSFNLEVVEATITTDSEGGIRDVFRIRKFDGSKVLESEFSVLQSAALEACSSTSKSNLPAIYGDVRPAAAAALAPAPGSQGSPTQVQAISEESASAMEMGAFELAQAASALAVLERELAVKVSLGVSDSASRSQIMQLEARRVEAAADLERRMGALQAMLQLRKLQQNRQRVEEERALSGVKAPPAMFMDRLREAEQINIGIEVEPAAAKGPGAELNQKGGTGTGPACGQKEVILQGFDWESHKDEYYKKMKPRIKELADVGFTAIWLPPPSESVSAQGYLPRDLYNLNSNYGTEAELRELISEIHEHGMLAVADIVINHRCAHSQDEGGRWNKFGGRLAWDSSVICANNPAFAGRGARKSEDDYSAAPNIDHAQERVRKDIIQWMQYLKNRVGFDGWRFDFVKGYSGVHAREYIDGTVPSMAFGEYWDTMSYADGVLSYNQDAHRQRTVNWCDKTGGTAAAFDFTTKGILQEAVGRKEYWRLIDSQGRPPGLIGLWPSRAVTFIENHDTGSTLQHWPFPWQHAAEGYCYLLTHPGTPCVFWDHYQFDPAIRKVIVDLVALRKRCGINCRSKVKIMTASGDVYGAIVDEKLAMKIGPGNWSPNQQGHSGFKIEASGPNWAVWVKQ